MIDNRPILVFDSGIGGLTTMFECAKLLPNEHFLYFADEQNMPYGNMPKSKLKQCLTNTLKTLIKTHNPKLVVLACNTATSVAISELRKIFLDVLFVGTEPAVVPALRGGFCPLVLCTQNTKQNSRILNLCQKYKKFFVCCPDQLATLVEQNYQTPKNILDYLKQQLVPFKNKVNSVVLGCTHYVFLKQQILNIFEQKIKVFDGNKGVANRVKNLLEFFDIFAIDGSIRFLNKGKTYTRLVCAYTTLLGG